jgi:hypothetical protein
MPLALGYLWAWFHDLHSGRTVNGMAHSPASHQDMLAWCSLYDIPLRAWEARALKRLGSVWLRVQHESPAISMAPPPPKVPQIRHRPGTR